MENSNKALVNETAKIRKQSFKFETCVLLKNEVDNLHETLYKFN